jgi:hypothetical protein
MIEITYEGFCVMFCGKTLNDNLTWIFEDEELTKKRLVDGLMSIGIKCIDVNIIMSNKLTGQHTLKCICLYNDWVTPLSYESKFYIDGLTTFDFGNTMEFGLNKII